MSRRPNSNTAKPLTQVSSATAGDLVVYSGRDAIGFIRTLGTGIYVAYDSGGKYLGRFPTQQAAHRRIWREQP
jgi:hypothetical protein